VLLGDRGEEGRGPFCLGVGGEGRGEGEGGHDGEGCGV